MRFQAKQIVVSPETTIENGLITVRDGIITDVSKSQTPSDQNIDLGSGTLVPGFVNAHTHLEFSCLEKPLGRPGMPFTDWLKEVIAWRMQAFESSASKTKAIRQGLAESSAAGVVAVGEIATFPVEATVYDDTELSNVLFLERISRSSDRFPALIEESDDWLARNGKASDSSNLCAISPHAPYSVHPELLQQLVKRAEDSRVPVAMHLAETREELELLSNQTGPFVEFLESVGAWNPATYRAGETILDYLKLLANAPRALVIHGNYLQPKEIDFIATNRDRMSVVYCPRTHAYFDHEPYPLEPLLTAGVNVAIGTDSRASNPDLSVYQELKLIKQRYPEMSDRQILTLGTENSARALGLRSAGANIATINEGRPADFNLIMDCQDQGGWFGESSSMLPFSQFSTN